MNTQDKETLKIYFNELSKIVDLYNPYIEYFWSFVALSIIAISLVVIASLGLLWGIILIGIGILPVIYKAVTTGKINPSEKELAERACIIMNQCVNLTRYSEDDTGRLILTYNSWSNNLPLYQEFIALFPHMASKKLKKLSCVKLRT